MDYLVVVPELLDGARLDKAASELLDGVSRNTVQTLADNGKLLLNGNTASKKTIVRVGDSITAAIDAPQPIETLPEDIPLDIVYEDKHLLVVNEPKGMVVHPAVGNRTGTMVNALLAHCSDLSGINGVIRPGIVHRIDKDTTGLLIVAKDDAAHNGLAAQIKEHSFNREYAAIVHGRFKDESFTIDAPIGRSQGDRKKMCVTDRGSRNAITRVEVLEELGGFSYVKCILETGRTHQIRVHMAYIGHPVVGDLVYGPKKPPIHGTNGQCLHAKTIGFVHPITGEELFFDSELPDYFVSILEKLRKQHG